ncbi:MAG: pantoate--beta-alanine ligase, partial [Actinobacteria bacterium]|nr:pantoate--beta-alanine ligase [Actinomycetota bacterium]
GALHAGHLSLVERCRDLADLVVVSIFVNPTQFGPGEDLDAYPRDLEGDEAALRRLGPATPELVFAPTVEEVYPREPLTTVSVRGLSSVLCGVSRPTHFDGVTTVVTKLFNIVRPDVAVFGRKDFQQLTILRRMVADLDQGVELVGGPIVREADGVAMSSRNRYLTGPDRAAARTLSRGLRAAVLAARDARDAGEVPTTGLLRDAATVTLAAEQRARIDYVEVLDPDTLGPPGDDADRWLVAVAAFVGPARLIDNVVVGERGDEDALLAATD